MDKQKQEHETAPILGMDVLIFSHVCGIWILVFRKIY